MAPETSNNNSKPSLDLSWFTPELQGTVWNGLLSSKDKRIVRDAKKYLASQVRRGRIEDPGQLLSGSEDLCLRVERIA